MQQRLSIDPDAGQPALAAAVPAVEVTAGVELPPLSSYTWRQRRQILRVRRSEPKPLDSWRNRLEAWLSLLFVDHGVLRLVWSNTHRVDDAMWRGSQPFPHHVRRAAKRGIRTIVSLRHGQGIGAIGLEREACARAGIDYVVLPLYSREPPTLEMLQEADRVFATIRYPAMLHCKSGADRAGLGAALYLLLHKRARVADVTKQLSLRYGHMKRSKTGVLDLFLNTYRREGESRGLGLIDWAKAGYDPVALRAAFHSNRVADVIVDRVLERE